MNNIAAIRELQQAEAAEQTRQRLIHAGTGRRELYAMLSDWERRWMSENDDVGAGFKREAA